MADDKSHASLGSHRTAGSKGSKGSKGSRSTRSHGSSSRGSYADTGRHGSNFSTVAPFVIAKPFILKKQRVREEAAAKARQVATAEEMLAADREAKIFEREMKLGRKLTARELKQHEPGGGVHLTSAEVREYLGLDGPVRNVPRKRSISAESGGQMVADLSAVKKGQDAAGGDGPAGVLSAEASFIQKRRELREVMEAREDKVEKTMTPEMAAMAKKWREKAEANAQRRQQGGLDTLAEEPESDDDRPLVAYDYSGGHGGRRWHRPSKYARASGGVAPGAADKAVKTLTPADFARAEEADVEFLESPMPLPQDPPGWRYKAGGAGVGYYFVRDQAMLEDLTTNRRSRSSVTGAPQVEKRQGWGRRCMRAFAANDFKALRRAELYAIELPRSRGRRRVGGAGRPKFDFHAGAPGRVHGDGADPRGRRHQPEFAGQGRRVLVLRRLLRPPRHRPRAVPAAARRHAAPHGPAAQEERVVRGDDPAPGRGQGDREQLRREGLRAGPGGV